MKINRPQGSIAANYVLPTQDAELVKEVSAALTWRNPDFDNVQRYSPYARTNIPERICMADYSDDSLKIPRGLFASRFLGVKLFKRLSKLKFADERVTEPVGDFPEPKLKYNEAQREMLRAIESSLIADPKKGNFLLIASTSAGKTVGQAAVARFLRQRTLVLCRTNLIKKAWQDDLYKFFGLGKSDIGLIQQKTMKLGKHFTLAMIPTLGRCRQNWDELFQYFGTVVLDEPQLAGSPTLVDFFNKCPARYIVGATATEKRADHKNFYVHAFFGTPVTEIDTSGTHTKSSVPLGDVDVVDTNFEYDNDQDDDLLNLNDLLAKMSVDEARNNVICERAFADWKAGRSVIVSVSRLVHAEILKDMLIDKGIEETAILSGESNTNTTYTRKLIDGVFSRSIRCIVASKNAVKLGANLNPLDSLHMACPALNPQDLEQLIGRIRRKFPGKKNCKVVYYRDCRDGYLLGKFKRVAVPVFRKLQAPGFKNLFIA